MLGKGARYRGLLGDGGHFYESGVTPSSESSLDDFLFAKLLFPLLAERVPWPRKD